MKYGIQYQPFARNIEVGRLNKAQNRFVGEKEDATAMAVGAVARWIVEEEEGAVAIDDDAGNTYRLLVTKNAKKGSLAPGDRVLVGTRPGTVVELVDRHNLEPGALMRADGKPEVRIKFDGSDYSWSTVAVENCQVLP